MAHYLTQLLPYPKTWMHSKVFRDFLNVISVAAIWLSDRMLFQKARVIREEHTS